MKSNDLGDDWDMEMCNRKLRRLADKAVLTLGREGLGGTLDAF
jgi:hypothetical protein